MKIHGTAKGGALSKKDFGVAFVAIIPGTDETYDGGNFANLEWVDLDSCCEGTMAYGETAETSDSTLIGRKISDLQFYAKQGSSPASGSVAAVMKNSGGTTIHTFWSGLAGTSLHVTGAWTNESSTAFSTAMEEDDYFAIETSASGSIANIARNKLGTGNLFDGSDSDGVTYLPLTKTGRDCYFKMTYTT